MSETQVIVNVLSLDEENLPDIMGIIGTSAALSISDIPWTGPIAGVRIGKLDDKLVINPTVEQLETSSMDIVVVGKKDSIIMVEGESHEISEDELVMALQYAQEAIADLVVLQEELIAEVGREKRTFEVAEVDQALIAAVDEKVQPQLAELNKPKNKEEHYGDIDAFKSTLQAELAEAYPEQEKVISKRIGELLSDDLRERTLKGVRAAGRKNDEIRDITVEVGVLPRAHGSSVFTRGETQALAVTTLGTKRDEQLIDDLLGTWYKNAMLHYNFPPFSVGEAKPMRGTSRREIGHGNLAERTITKVLPAFEDFPYTIRIVSEILESNGSSSMATVCAACMSLMDAGVPIRKPVAGIAMGLIKEGDKYVILSDILGTEDHLGDMDFKVAGTAEGINAIQMDLKTEGISVDIMREALEQAKEGRLHILGEMMKVLDKSRPDLSEYAPRIFHTTINPEKIGALIGPGGRVIKAIAKETGCSIDVDDDGSVVVSGSGQDDLESAIKMVKLIATDPEVGATYEGTVVRVMDFGAFVSIAPGKEGLVHISQLAHERVNKVEDVARMGDKFDVKLIKIDDLGRLDFSRKALIEPPPGFTPREDKDSGSRNDRPSGGRSRRPAQGGGGRRRR
jgi:polyribonucleotide nucleotidyltransferase